MKPANTVRLRTIMIHITTITITAIRPGINMGTPQRPSRMRMAIGVWRRSMRSSNDRRCRLVPS